MANLFFIVLDLNHLMVDLSNSDKVNKRDVYYLMGKTRELLEEVGMNAETNPEIKVLKVYCNWVLHSKLSSSSWIHNSLVELNEGLIQFLEGDEHIKSKCFKMLDLASLRSGLLSVLNHYSVNTDVIRECDKWDEISSVLLGLVKDKPLCFPKEVLDGTKHCNKYKQILNMRNIADISKIIGLSISSYHGRHEFHLHTSGIPTRVPVEDKGTIYLANSGEFYLEIQYC